MTTQIVGRPIRVGLVDDHHIVREGLRLLLDAQPDVEIVGEAAGRDEAFSMVRETDPDVVVLDVSLGDDDAVPLIGALRSLKPGIQILVLTMHRDSETVRQALLAGAPGYLVKGAYTSELVTAVRAVSRGESYLHSSIAGTVVGDSVRWLQSSGDLTAREREVLSLFASGESATRIGDALGISTNTVRRHLANLAGKLELKGRAALTRYAAEHGVVRVPTR